MGALLRVGECKTPSCRGVGRIEFKGLAALGDRVVETPRPVQPAAEPGIDPERQRIELDGAAALRQGLIAAARRDEVLRVPTVGGCVTGIERERPAKCRFCLGQPPFVEGKQQRAGRVRFREVIVDRQGARHRCAHAGKRLLSEAHAPSIRAARRPPPYLRTRRHILDRVGRPFESARWLS